MSNWLEFLQEELKKDIELLQKLESELRSEGYPRQQLRLEDDIKRIKKQIEEREKELAQTKLKIKEREKELAQAELKIKEREKELAQAELKIKEREKELEKIKLDIAEDNHNKIEHNHQQESKSKLRENKTVNISPNQDVDKGQRSNSSTHLNRIIFLGITIISMALAIGIFLVYNKSNTICPNIIKNSDENFYLAKSFSCGEKSLISGSIISNKSEGIKAYKNNNYQKAVDFFEDARKEQPNDPETLLYLNNAKIERDTITAYTIAVVVPLNSNFYTSIQILRGVAQAQEQFINEKRSQQKIGLKVLIVNDDNNVDKAKEIANVLVKQSHIFAVIGHYASDLTLVTRDIYENGKLVIVTPGSTSTKLPRQNDKFFFRTIPSLENSSTSLLRYLDSKYHKKVAVFHNPSSEFSKPFFEELNKKISVYKNITITNNPVELEFHLSNPFFDPNLAIKKANNKGVQAFVVIPDGGTTSYSLRNAFKLIKVSSRNIFVVGANPLFSDETLLLGEDVVGRLLVTTPWIQTTVSQSIFANKAQELWGDKEISPWAVTGYDAAKALIEALFIKIQDQPTRLKLRDTLADPKFEAKGADEQNPIKFDNGNRKKESVELAKIVKSKCSKFGYSFVPEEYQESQIQQLNSSCQ